MTRASIAVPVSIVSSLSLPHKSLVNGSSDVELVRVRTLGGSPRRRNIEMIVPVDAASAEVVHRTLRRRQFNAYVLQPLYALVSLSWIAVTVLLLLGDTSVWHRLLWLYLPLLTLSIGVSRFSRFVTGSALRQHPRREKFDITISDIPQTLAEEIVKANPEVKIAK